MCGCGSIGLNGTKWLVMVCKPFWFCAFRLALISNWNYRIYCWHFDTVGTVYHLVIYMQSNKIHNVVLRSKFYSALFVSSTCFGPHRSIIRSVLYKLYSQTLVCGNTRTTRHVQPQLDVSSWHLVQHQNRGWVHKTLRQTTQKTWKQMRR